MVFHLFPVALARGKHLFPFRTEQLSPSAPMVLGSQGPGRVGRRRFFLKYSGLPQGGPWSLTDTWLHRRIGQGHTAVGTDRPTRVVGDLPRMTVGIDEHPGVAAPEGLVSRVINSLAFPGAWTRLTPAAIGPCATGTPTDTVERQITTTHPENTDRIYDSGHSPGSR